MTPSNRTIRAWMFNNYESYLDKSNCLELAGLAEQACDSTDGYDEYNYNAGVYGIPEQYFEIAVQVQEELYNDKLINK